MVPSKNDHARLSIIIVNWNGKHLLEDCIGSIERYGGTIPLDVFIVDNDSSDGSQEWMKTRVGLNFPLYPILNSGNVGFGRANNQAMKSSQAEYFLLLNSDATLAENAVSKAIEFMDDHPTVGVLGPRLLNTDGTLQASTWRGVPTPWEVLLDGLRIYKLLPRQMRGELLLGGHWDHSREREVGCISGAAMFIRREVFEETGGFSPDFFMYGEDVEWQFRIREKGFRISFLPDSVVYHHSGESSIAKWGNREKIKVQQRGFLRFQQKSLSKLHVKANCLSILLISFFERKWRRLRGVPTLDLDATAEVYRDFLRKGFVEDDRS